MHTGCSESTVIYCRAHVPLIYYAEAVAFIFVNNIHIVTRLHDVTTSGRFSGIESLARRKIPIQERVWISMKFINSLAFSFLRKVPIKSAGEKIKSSLMQSTEALWRARGTSEACVPRAHVCVCVRTYACN